MAARSPTIGEGVEWHEMAASTSKVTFAEQPGMQDSHSSRGYSPPYVAHERGADVQVSKGTRRILYALKFFIGVLLFILVLGCSMFSKLSLVSITDKLRTVTWNISQSPPSGEISRLTDEAASLYWQLFFVLILPNALTFGRSFVFGVFGKTRKSFPWPTPSAILLVRTCCRLFMRVAI